MADPLHVNLVRQGTLAIAEWRRTHPEILLDLEAADLSRVVLSGAVLGNARLWNANLSNADLTGADLRGCTLHETNLRGATLRGANLTGVRLCGANLTDSDLRDTNLRAADLRRANMAGADRRGACMEEADLGWAKLTEPYPGHVRFARKGVTAIAEWRCRHPRTRFDLSRANLCRRDLAGADLHDADLTGSTLVGANLRGATLERADLSAARLVGAALQDADLTEAILDRADLHRANLTGAKLEGAKLALAFLDGAVYDRAALPTIAEHVAIVRRGQRGIEAWRKQNPQAQLELACSDLRGARLEGARLRSVRLSNSDLEGAELMGADLQEADLHSANLRAANLADAKLRGADLERADLSCANLASASLNGACLQNANLEGANLEGCDLRGADLRLARLGGARLANALLKGADLSKADLLTVDLSGVNLTGIDLRQAELPRFVGLHESPQRSHMAGARMGRFMHRESISLDMQLDVAEDEPAKNTEPPDQITDNVHFSITTAVWLEPTRWYVLDVWAHLSSQRGEVIRRARQAQESEKISVRSKGPIPVQRGATIQAELSLPGFRVEDPEDRILWDGGIGNASFAFQSPGELPHGTYLGTVTLRTNGFRIAKLHFVLEVQSDGPTTGIARPRDERFKTAYASYSSKDRDEVLGRIQGMQKVCPDLDIFLDVASLRSGENWQQRLEQEVTRRDVFYLFWSEAASRSQWVDKEWRLAWGRRGIDYIDPVPLVSPEVVAPPPELAGELHFGDWVLAFRRERAR